uniref:Uncharacterized protein n=1 Tax=Fagus sylvatica TaxID=28930 RepID=A0A2N9HIZ2_FAGSY
MLTHIHPCTTSSLPSNPLTHQSPFSFTFFPSPTPLHKTRFLIRSSASDTQSLPKSAIQRIAHKLRSLGFTEDPHKPKPKPEPKCRRNLHPSAPSIAQTPSRAHPRYELVHSGESGSGSGYGFGHIQVPRPEARGDKAEGDGEEGGGGEERGESADIGGAEEAEENGDRVEEEAEGREGRDHGRDRQT